MVTRSLAGLVAAVGGLALSLAGGAGAASAAPDLGPAINTTCDYSQVVSALNAEDPPAAAEFDASPTAQSWLHTFLASPPDKRQQMAQQMQGVPEAQQYFGTVAQIANTCSNY
jgi:hemophore-related protein